MLSSNSGFDVPPNVTSSTNEMLVSLYSDYYLNFNGFYINIYENPHFCEQWIDYKKGTIKSPTFPDEKTNKFDCLWLITADEGFTITINVEHLYVRLFSNCKVFPFKILIELQLTRSLEGVTYFDGPTNRSRVIWEDNGFLHPYRFNRSSTGNSMLISFQSGWRLPRTYGFFFRIYCNPPAQGSRRIYNTKPEFCLSKSIVKSKIIKRKLLRKFDINQLDYSNHELDSKLRSFGSKGKLDSKSNPIEYRYV